MKSNLEYALEFAGDNRNQLENVLNHYKDNYEKLMAAKYLIVAMPLCYSYSSKEIDSRKKEISVVICNKTNYDTIIKSWLPYNYLYADKIYDAHIISSEYLIEHIDRVFEFRKLPWNKNLIFEDFCELLLPYRIAHEPLEKWIIPYGEYFQPIIDSCKKEESIIDHAVLINNNLLERGFIHEVSLKLPHLGAMYLLENRFGECRESTNLTLYAMRSVGIPCAIDFNMASPTHRGGSAHYWNIIRNSDGTDIPFWFEEQILKYDNKLFRKAGKIFRKCYGIQKPTFKNQHIDKRVVSWLRDPQLKDVTSLYYGENSVTIKVNTNQDEEYVYLGIFNRNSYIPIAISAIDTQTATFKNIEPEVFFQPITLSENQSSKMAGFPFIMIDGSIKRFKPEISSIERVTLKRKYLPHEHWNSCMNIFPLGASFYGSNSASLKDKKNIYTIQDSLHVYNIFNFTSHNKYRYIEFKTLSNRNISISEMAFYSNGDNISYKGHGCKPTEDRKSIAQNIYDNNISTYYEGQLGSSYIIDFGRPIRVDSILFIPRNDDNFVVKGEEYELLYNAGAKGWISILRQVADNTEIIADVPKNSLLWLRNHTKGIEEQVFYMEDGEQCFPPCEKH